MKTGILGMLRPGNAVIAVIGVFTGHSLAQGAYSLPVELITGMASAFLITGAGNLVNDYFDSDIDSRLGRAKVTEKNAKMILALSLILFTAGIVLAGFINTEALAIALGVSLMLLLYSWKMQEHKALGNWVIALGTAMTLVFGAAISGNYGSILLFAGAAFFVNVGREITKDLEDLKGDEGVKKTLPMMVDFRALKTIILALYIAGLVLAASAFALGIITGAVYPALIGITTALLLASWVFLGKEKFRESQRLSKFGMVSALAAFLGSLL